MREEKQQSSIYWGEASPASQFHPQKLKLSNGIEFLETKKAKEWVEFKFQQTFLALEKESLC